MVVADDELDAAQAALHQALEEGAPMNFGFAEGDAHAENVALAFRADAQGDEHGTVAQLPVVADFFMAGVEHQIGMAAQGPVAPFLQLGIQELRALADLGGADGGAAEFLDDGGDFAGGDALDIHLGHGQLEGLFGADALLQGAGIEVEIAPDLGDAKGDGADAAGEGLGFVTVGVTLAGVGALVRPGLEGLLALDAHGFVDEQAQALGKGIVALLGQELQDVVQEIRIGVVGHVWFGVGCVCDTPTAKPAWPAPDQFFPRAEPLSPLRGSAALAIAPPHPEGGKAGWKKNNLQKDFYTD